MRPDLTAFHCSAVQFNALCASFQFNSLLSLHLKCNPCAQMSITMRNYMKLMFFRCSHSSLSGGGVVRALAHLHKNINRRHSYRQIADNQWLLLQKIVRLLKFRTNKRCKCNWAHSKSKIIRTSLSPPPQMVSYANFLHFTAIFALFFNIFFGNRI